MDFRKWGGACLLLAAIAMGFALLLRPAGLEPESLTRQDAVFAGLSPVGFPRTTDSTALNLKPIVNSPVAPVTVNLLDIPANQYFENNEYDRWRRGEIDLEKSEEFVSEAERRRLQEIAGRIPPDSDVQNIGPTADFSLQQGFAALDIDDCCGGGQLTPPDPDLAVGEEHVLAVVNAAFTVQAQSDGGILAGPTTLSSFFAALGGSCAYFPFDPNALYDEEAQRYILAADGNGDSYCVAVSATSNPLESWHLYAFPTSVGGAFFDYPQLGVGSDAIYMGGNLFGAGTGRVWAFDKWAMYAGQPAASVSQATGTDKTPQPLKAHGYQQGTWPAPGAHFFLAHRAGAAIYALYRWQDPFGSNQMALVGTYDLSQEHDVSVGYPIDSVQQDGQPIKGNDNRPLDFEWRNGSGWMTSAVSCNPGGGVVNCVQWAEFDLTSMTLAQAGVFASPGGFRTFPDMAVNHCGDMAIGYTHSSAVTFPSVQIAGRAATAPPGLMSGEALIKAGEQRYTGYDGSPYRWGDYTSLSIAPDGVSFWYLGQYASQDASNQTANWATYAKRFTYDGCAAAPDFHLAVSPDNAAVCLPAATYLTVTVDALNDFTHPVTLQSANLPAGYQAKFTANPLPPDSSAGLTLSPLSAVDPGSYAVDIVGHTPTRTHTATLTLALFSGLPEVVAPLAPTKGAGNIPAVPSFRWTAAAHASTYRLTIATDPGLEDVVYSVSVVGVEHEAEIALAPLTTYFWSVQASNACGDGPAAMPVSFTTAEAPPILLVDDDDNGPDVLPAYSAALDALDLGYAVFDTGGGDAEPAAALLQQYDMVVWFTGDAYGGGAGPGSSAETALSTYLDAGNCLLLSSQDYLFDRALTPFMQSYLGVGGYLNDVAHNGVTGLGLFESLGYQALEYPFPNYSDRLLPAAAAESVFAGTAGGAGVSLESGWKSVFLGFPLEALRPPGQTAVLQAFHDWCAGAPTEVMTISVDWLLDSGLAGSDVLSLREDGTFVDQAGATGSWFAQSGPPRLSYYYTDGSNCAAFSRGTEVQAGEYKGYRLCTDGTLARGLWDGLVVLPDAVPTSLTRPR